MVTQSPESMDTGAKPVKEVLDTSILRVQMPDNHFEVKSAVDALFDPCTFFMMSSGLVPEWPVRAEQKRKMDDGGDV